MFFSQGDSSRLEDEELKTLSNIRRMVETGHIKALQPKETEVALRALDFYGRWESFFNAVGSLRNIVVITAAGLGFWWATGGENFITDFIRGVVGQ